MSCGEMDLRILKKIGKICPLFFSRNSRKGYSKRYISVIETSLSHPVISSATLLASSIPYLAILLLEVKNSTSTDIIHGDRGSSIVKSLSRFNPFRGSPRLRIYTTPADIRIIAAEYSASLRRIKIQPEGCRLETSH